MAGSTLCAARILFLFLINFVLVFSGPTGKPVQVVPNSLIQSALNALNEDSPTHHTYKGGNLISAQKSDESQYVKYRLTFNLTSVCKEAIDPCPQEICTVEVKQHEQGEINVSKEFIQCMYLYPQTLQDESVQTQEINHDQEVIENLDKQIANTQSVELDHEIQKTGDHNDRPFIAMRASNPSYCPGCPYELNPTLPGLVTFGEQAARSMDELIPNDYKHKLINIIKVIRAVPPSSNVVQYQILLRIGESDCLKNAIDQSECSVQTDRPVKVCLVTFEEQPWQASSRKITKNNCTMSNDMAIELNVNTAAVMNTEALVTSVPENKEIDSEKIEALDTLKDMLDYNYATSEKVENEDQSEVTEHPFVKVTVNRSQDDTKVEGFEDKAKDFDEFLKDFDLPTRTAKSNVNIDKEEVKEDVILPKRVLPANSANAESQKLYRNKRETTLVGAPSQKNIDDPHIQALAAKGLQKFSANSEGTNEPIIVEIVEATQQVVSGTLYKIKVKLGNSNCTRGVQSNCQLKEGSEMKECLFTIWSRVWMDRGKPQITINCDLNNRRKRSLRGSQYSQKMLKLSQNLKAENLFEEFLVNYDRTYSSVDEKQMRFKVFKKNLDIIEELQNFEKGTAQYGVTMFADLTPKEFKTYLGYRPDLKQDNEIPLQNAEIPDIPLPPKFDWRDHNVVTPVKNQGQCGSCWAFSTTGNIEGQYAIKHKKLLSLSEQELVDCDKLDNGCGGGEMTNAYRTIEQLGGLELETDYPYEARNEKCHFIGQKARVQVASAVNITSDETKMAQWLVANGPISIAINANAMQFYMGGVSHPLHFLCSPNSLDHGVLIVGYGTSKYPLFNKDLPYWIIKNSWGERWGEKGYYRVYRGDGTCGVNAMASSAIVA